MRSFEEIQMEIGAWAQEQFGKNSSKDQTKRHFGQPLDEICSFYGMVSELGELAAVDVRAMQGRSKLPHPAQQREAREDALADCLVFMCDYACRSGINLNAVLDRVWEKVRQRRQQTWEQDKAKEDNSPEAAMYAVSLQAKAALEATLRKATTGNSRPGDATANFGAGCEEGNHEFVPVVDIDGHRVRRCRLCEVEKGM